MSTERWRRRLPYRTQPLEPSLGCCKSTCSTPHLDSKWGRWKQKYRCSAEFNRIWNGGRSKRKLLNLLCTLLLLPLRWSQSTPISKVKRRSNKRISPAAGSASVNKQKTKTTRRSTIKSDLWWCVYNSSRDELIYELRLLRWPGPVSLSLCPSHPWQSNSMAFDLLVSRHSIIKWLLYDAVGSNEKNNILGLN